MKQLVVIGAGGHARPVIDVAMSLGYEIIGIIDVDYTGAQETLMGVDVIGGMEKLTDFVPSLVMVFIAVGDNNKRKAITEKVMSYNFDIPSLVHNSSIISHSVMMGKGVFINAGAIINAMAAIGSGAIINTGAIVDHESLIGDFSHVAPGVSIAGRVAIGSCSFIGVGTSVIDKINIGENVIVGAGSTIIKDVESNTKVVGVSRILD
jgi:sugar O-acyltransferase (sialic acid O-acetyltransferase NeuD family)